ncbi:MAG: hypothetical protein ACE147_09455 [Candidatus Methylomirabilales bacterium]
MLTLPLPPRRVHLQAFALALGISAGLALGGLLALVWSATGAVVGLGLGLLAGAAALGAEPLRGAYLGWARLSTLYARAVRLSMKALCFLILAVAARRGGAALTLAHPNLRSLWTPRPATAAGASRHARRGWKGAYAAWALASPSRWWALGLLPFLLVLAAADTDAEAALPSDTYTLF